MALSKQVIQPVRAMSFDFEGCLYNENYHQHYDSYKYMHGNKNGSAVYAPVIQANIALIKIIKQDNKRYAKNIVMNGSELQSNKLIKHGKKGGRKAVTSDLCTESLKEISEVTHTEMDDFLLADAYGNKYPGYSYLAASSPEYDSKKFDYVHPKSYLDETMLTIVYAQMHKLANEHYNRPVVFEYYASDSNKLGQLQEFFENNPDLVPQNVTLQLKLYKTTIPTAYDDSTPKTEYTLKEMKPIIGRGMIDKNYYNTVREIHNALIPLFDHNSNFRKQAKRVLANPQLKRQGAMAALPNREEIKPIMKLSDVHISAKSLAETRERLTEIDVRHRVKAVNLQAQLKAVVNKGSRYAKHNNINAQKAVMNLHDTLHQSIEQLNARPKVTKQDLKKFERTANEAIDKAHEEISKSNWKKKMTSLNPVKTDVSHVHLFKKLKADIKKQIDAVKDDSPHLTSSSSRVDRW